VDLVADDDSEPILGQWFEETLSPEEPATSLPSTDGQTNPDSEGNSNNNDGRHPHRMGSNDGPSFVPDRKEPDGVSYRHVGHTSVLFMVCFCILEEMCISN